MKIELKNIKTNLTFSEETIMFNADVYVDGVKVAYAKNDGRGGSTFYHPYEGMRELVVEAENYCKGLPPIVMENYSLDMNLEFFIDELIEKEIKKKEKKKLEKQMETCIMWGKPNANKYTQVRFKKPLKEIPSSVLQQYVDKFKKDFLEGEVFLNTNFQELGVVS